MWWAARCSLFVNLIRLRRSAEQDFNSIKLPNCLWRLTFRVNLNVYVLRCRCVRPRFISFSPSLKLRCSKSGNHSSLTIVCQFVSFIISLLTAPYFTCLSSQISEFVDNISVVFIPEVIAWLLIVNAFPLSLSALWQFVRFFGWILISFAALRTHYTFFKVCD